MLIIKKAKVILAKTMVKSKNYGYAIKIFEKLDLIAEDSEYLYLYGQVLEEKTYFLRRLKFIKK